MILWHDKNGSAERASQLLQPAFRAPVEAIRAKRPASWIDHLLQRDVELKPIAADTGRHRLTVLCCAAPRGRLPLEVKTFLFQHRLGMGALACVLITDTTAANTAPAIEDIERHASQRPIALLELTRRELDQNDRNGHGSWTTKRKIEDFLVELKQYKN